MATESVTFMLANTDRSNPTVGHGAPVGYVLSHPATPVMKMRQFTNKVIIETHKGGDHVIAVGFDGTYHTMICFSDSNTPQTVLALIKQRWQQTSKCNHGVIMDKMHEHSQEKTHIITQTDGKFYVSSSLNAKLIIPFADNEGDSDDEADDIIDLEEPVTAPSLQAVTTTRPFQMTITQDSVSSLQLFLPQKSKLHSLSDCEMYTMLGDIKDLSTNSTVADLKAIIKWLKSLTKLQDKCMKLSGNKADLASRLEQVLHTWNTPFIIPSVFMHLITDKSGSKETFF